MMIQTLIAAIVTVLFLLIIIAFLFFTRIGKNFLVYIHPRKSKRSATVYLKCENTEEYEKWNVAPEPDYLTQVGKFYYDLNSKYKLMTIKGRNIFLVHEGDAIPKYPARTDSDKEVLFQVKEIKAALENRAYDFLYVKKQNIALILCAIGFFIAIIVAVYALYYIGEMKPMIEWLYAHPPAPSPITNPEIQIGK